MPDLGPDEQRLAAFALNAFWTPTVWNWLLGTCGLTTDEAIRTASWAIRNLTEALKRDASGLQAESVATETTAAQPGAKKGGGKHK
jgi:hypothetical protein